MHFFTIFTRVDTIKFLHINHQGKSLFVMIGIVSQHWSELCLIEKFTILICRDMEIFNRCLFLFNSFIIIKSSISSSNLLLYHFIQTFMFHRWSRLTTGFTINIDQRENKADILQHKRFYPLYALTGTK